MPAHHVMLEGSTYKPERRSAMAQTLGPLTAVLLSYRTKDPYRQKWLEAVKRDVGHIPNAINLANAMYNRRAEEVAPALGAFADYLLISGARNAQRAFFPINMLIDAALPKVDEPMDTGAATPEIPPLVDFEDIVFSGKGIWLVYKTVMDRPFTLETAMDDVTAGQVVYHAIFGTQNEDLGILQEITSHKTPWRLRSEIAGMFRSENKSVRTIKLPRQVYYSKLAQANMTGLLTESSFQVCCKQVFDGKRSAHYIDSFFNEGPSHFASGMTLSALASFFRELKRDLLKKKDNHPVHGSVKWRLINGLTSASHGSEAAIELRETGRYFCGRAGI